MGVLSEILRQIQRNRIASSAVGGAGGALLGSALNQDDPGGGALGLGAFGAALGALGGGRRIPIQALPVDSAFEGQLTRWGAKQIDAPNQMGLAQRAHAALVDERSPWYFDNPEVEQVASNLLHGGMSEVNLYHQDLINQLEELNNQGLREEARTWLAGSTVPRAWDTIRFKQQQAWDDAATARGAGNMEAYSRAKALYDEYTQKINERTVATQGMTEEDFLSERAAQQARLGPERYAAVEKFGTAFQDKLWEITQAKHRLGEIADEDFARYADQRARGIPYFPSFRSGLTQQQAQKSSMEQILQAIGAQDPAAASLLRPATESQQFGRLRGISVPGLDELKSFMSLEGSTLPLDDPLASGFYYLQEGIRQSKRNQATKVLIDGAYANAPVRSDGTPFIRELNPGEVLKAGEGAVQFLDAASPSGARHFAVPVEWSDLLHGAEARDISMGLQVMGKIQRLNSAMITGQNVGFIAGNVFRDVQAAWILTKQNPQDLGKFLKYWIKAADASLQGNTSDTLTREAFAEGAMGANLSRQLKWSPEWMEAAGLEEPGVLNTITSRLRSFTNATEEATKVASYKLMRERGMNPAEAAFNTRRYAGSPDFARMGSAAPQLRPLIQFWNPQVQGIARNIERAKQDPAYMASWMGALAAGYMALETYNRQYINPESGRPWMEDIPEWERNSNLIFLLPGTTTHSNGVTKPNAIKIPLDHVARLMLSPFVSAAQNLMGDPNAPDFAQALSNLGSQTLPLAGPIDMDKPLQSAALQLGAATNPLIRLPVEQIADRQAFSDSPIVGARLGGLAAPEQFTENTSPTAKTLAHAIGWSPARVEHLLRGVLPGMGTQMLDAADMRNRVAMGPTEISQRLPILGGIMSRFTLGRGSAERDRLSEGLYEQYAKGDEVTRTINAMRDRGASDQEFDSYVDQNAGTMAAAKGVRKFVKQLSVIREQREMILRDPEMTPEERAASLKELEELKMELLRGAAPLLELAKPGREALQ